MDEIERRSFAWNSRDICISLDLVSSWLGMACSAQPNRRCEPVSNHEYSTKIHPQPAGVWTKRAFE